MTTNNQTNSNSSFFSHFSVEKIFEHWSSSKTLLEIAQKLGFNDPNGLARADYEHITSIKTREVWQQQVISKGWKKEKERPTEVSQLSAEELTTAMNFEGVQTVSHLALHFLLSPKHGREVVKKRIIELNLPVKESLHWGVHGVSANPEHWPTYYYEKRIGKKKMECSRCGFVAKKSQQIELHHPQDIDAGPKSKRNVEYYRTKDIKELCANCHSLEQRTGERSLAMCGKWRISLPGTQKYQNPDLIFSENCSESYRLQKVYYLKWVLSGPEQYKCQECSADYWGPGRKLLSLELHHKDGSHKNSLINNLALLCPNCHRYYTQLANEGN